MGCYDLGALPKLCSGRLSAWDASYTWGERREKAFHFLMLIEIIAVDSFREIGVNFPKIKLAHSILSKTLDTNYPFAHAELMTDGKRISHKHLDESLLEVDEKQQFSFTKQVAPYCKKIDFQDKTQLGERFWPLGKDHESLMTCKEIALFFTRSR